MVTDGGAEDGTAGAPRAGLGPALAVAGLTLVVHLGLSGRYGFHRDELYYLTAGRHPAAGYVDQPPFVPLVARAVTAVAGERLWPLRAVAGLAHAALVVVAGMLARDLGGKRWAVGVAAVATAVAPVFVATGGMFQTVVFDQLWWALIVLLVIRLLRGGDRRLWLAVGALVGLGLQTKWTVALLGIGLAVGCTVVPEARARLRGPWPWLGVALAALLWAPNLVWQALNGWPTLEFTEHNNETVQAEQGRAGFVAEQFLLMSPVAVPLVAAGLVWTWRRRPWRALAAAVIAMFVILLVAGGKSYYLAPAYVLLFAAGAVAAEPWAGSPRRRRAVPVALVVGGLVPLPAVAPVLAERAYVDTFYDLNDEMGEQLGWPQLADQVAAVYLALPAGERADARILTSSYGEAAALDLYGPSRGIPRGVTLSAHNSYVDWWPDGEPAGTVIVVRYRTGALAPHCGAIERVATITNPWDAPNQVAGTPISVCRRLRTPPGELRDALRHFE